MNGNRAGIPWASSPPASDQPPDFRPWVANNRMDLNVLSKLVDSRLGIAPGGQRTGVDAACRALNSAKSNSAKSKCCEAALMTMPDVIGRSYSVETSAISTADE